MLYNKLYKLKKICLVKKNIQENLYYKHTKIHNIIDCYYCNGLGWIAWKSSNNSMLLHLNPQPKIILYSICVKCQ